MAAAGAEGEETMPVEITFFVIGVLPWWWLCLKRDKTRTYWAGYLAVAFVWCFYYGLVHKAWAALVNNTAELAIAWYGLWRITHGGKQ